MSDREILIRDLLQRLKDYLATHDQAWWHDGEQALRICAADVEPENLRIMTGKKPGYVAYESFRNWATDEPPDETFKAALAALLDSFRAAGPRVFS